MFNSEFILDNVARILVLVLAISVHEWAHAFAAYKSGDPTAKIAGRMTLNPAKHFDPIGFFMMLFLPVAFAKPVPVNPYNFRNRRRGEVWVSLAGVLTNLLTAILFTFALTCFLQFVSYEFFASGFGFFLTRLLVYFCTVNLSLMVFNLLPIYPLDGFRFLEATTKPMNKFRRFMYKYGHYILVGLLLESVAMGWLASNVHPVFQWFDILGNVLGKLIDLIWTPLLWVFERFWGLFA